MKGDDDELTAPEFLELSKTEEGRQDPRYQQAAARFAPLAKDLEDFARTWSPRIATGIQELVLERLSAFDDPGTGAALLTSGPYRARTLTEADLEAIRQIVREELDARREKA